MTDIRKCAQAVIDRYDNRWLLDSSDASAKVIEALRQALAEPVEPVVVQVNGHVFHRDGKQFIQFEQKSPSLDVQRFHLNENDLPPFLDKLVRPVEPVCNPHPDAPHGFNRNASHTEDRPACDCESWEPPSLDALIAEIDGLTVKHFSEKGVDYFCYDMGEVNAILDKYRGQK